MSDFSDSRLGAATATRNKRVA
ncbi:MAG: hypothetical protein JWP99_1145, partial [Devosia sp.]|nr:hypothetical protein [Devosia sp.]